MNIHTLRAFLLAAVFLTNSAFSDQTFVWWEGEDAIETNFSNAGWLKVKGEEIEVLSGGSWLHEDGDLAADEIKPYAKYKVQVDTDGVYQFWVRKFWKHGPFQWRFNKEKWQQVSRNIALHEGKRVRDKVSANWVYLGDVELDQGQHIFEFELTSDKTKLAAFDAFVLVEGPFNPRGKLKPGEKSGKSEKGFFAWEPEVDPLTDGSFIDMRYLNEPVAGQSGFVKRSGKEFQLGDGSPVRFWMVEGGSLMQMKNASIDRWSRRLAKYGVNLVRIPLSGFFSAYTSGDRRRFENNLDRLHYVVSSLKRQGIYTYLGHLFWHTHKGSRITEDVFPGFGEGKQPISLLFFSNEFQDFYKSYARDVMLADNPYTGLPLAKDPAVAFYEIQNESGLLFWSFQPEKFPATELELIERRFADFLTAKYGSLDGATAGWTLQEKQKHTPDKLAQGRVGLYPAGMLTGNDWAVEQRDHGRAADQLQFLYESAKDFYAKMTHELKNEIGLGQLIVGSNWKTADDRLLGGLERHAYTAADAVCRNVYFDVEYSEDGRQTYYAIELNDTFRSQSALTPPAKPAPLATPQILDFPFMITENNWTRPNRYRTEWPFLVATYAQMMGIDGWNFFALDSAEWNSNMGVWDLNNPSVMAQFPAAALVYRSGYVTEPDTPAVHENVALDEVYAFKGSAIHAVSGKDALWVSNIGAVEGGKFGGFDVDPRAFLVGPVVQKFHDGESSVKTVDLSDYIDGRGKIRSFTGELVWNYKVGVVTVDTPMVKGATGFLKKAGKIKFSDAIIRSENDYGTILIVSMDGKAITESKKILIQAGTWDIPFGFETKQINGYEKIINLGGYPLNVKRIKARVEFSTGGQEVIVLDENGYPTKKNAQYKIKDGKIIVTLPEDSLYTVIR